VVRDRKVQDIADHRLDLLDARIAEFKDVIAVAADEVVVLAEGIGLLETTRVFSELVALDEFAIHQQFQRIVNGRAGNPVSLIFHMNEKRFHVEVIGQRIDFFEYVVAFFRLAVMISFEVIIKYFLNGLLRVFQNDLLLLAG
jgi:hypothetical protein